MPHGSVAVGISGGAIQGPLIRSQVGPRTMGGMPKRMGSGIALLADETRRRIVAEIALRPLRPAAIASAIGLSRPATSRQLRLLREAGLVRAIPSRIDRRGTLYLIEPLAHGRITAWLAGTEVAARPAAAGRPAGNEGP
jgi:DNA-binding transcriptional ArsR family regulator